MRGVLGGTLAAAIAAVLLFGLAGSALAAPPPTFSSVKIFGKADPWQEPWRFRKTFSLPPGNYRAVARGIDLSGNRELPAKRRNIVKFTIG